MPLPFPAAEVGPAAPAARGRKRQRAVKRRIGQQWVNRVIALFNWYTLGPKAFASAAQLASQQVSALQLRYAHGLLDEVLLDLRAPAPDLGPNASGAGRLTALVHKVASSGYRCSSESVDAAWRPLRSIVSAESRSRS